MFSKKFLLAVCFVFFIPLVSGSVYLDVNFKQEFIPSNSTFPGGIQIIYDTPLPNTSFLYVYLDDSSKPNDFISISPYLQESYNFGTYTFHYNITAHGVNTWLEYPEENFYFKLHVSGICGDEDCASTNSCNCYGLCGPPYPCEFSLIYPSTSFLGPESVNNAEGLKEVYDATSVINIPPDAHDIVWDVTTEENPNVQTTMRESCGWVRKSLTNFQPCGVTCHKAMVGRFDEKSLLENREKYISGECKGNICGGVYRRNKNNGNIEMLKYPDEVRWNGSLGEVYIFVYDPENYEYLITYLPPNGPKVCAYTDTKNYRRKTWIKSKLQTGKIKYNQTFTRVYSEIELPYEYNNINKQHAIINPPECSPSAFECEQRVSFYEVLTDDPFIILEFDSAERKVTAELTKPVLSGNYTLYISFSDFLNLSTPEEAGTHKIKVKMKDNGIVLASTEAKFYVCEDYDGDGFCNETGDCNDNESNVHPGAKEICDYLDNDCDGKIDEDFPELGEPCGYGICRGVYVCSENGSIRCDGPEPMTEICNDSLDNDCDGVVDEKYEKLPTGEIVSACVEVCKPGDRKPCGSNIGRCREGYRLCVNGEWSMECIGKIGPFPEVCNGEDDDCDGIVDNVGGGTSIEETRCQCYNNNPPKTEICNDIDDDCDGKIDENPGCCKEGEEKPCGKGICKGIKRCINGTWGECEGEKPDPRGEVCWDSLDNDCDGEVDENCDLRITCNNGYKDVNEEGIDCGGECKRPCGIDISWVFFSIGIIFLIIGIMLAELRGEF